MIKQITVDTGYMLTFCRYFLVLLSIVFSVFACVHAQPAPEPGFVSLFDGKSLKGWRHAPGYHATNGVLVCTKSGGKLLSDNVYSNFVLRLEYKLTPGGNNGIAIRSDPTRQANEIQILDDDAPAHARLEPAQYNGSLYMIFPARRGFAKPPGEWNSFEVMADGPHIKITLNGTTIVDGDLNQVSTERVRSHPGLNSGGHIGFLGHATPVEFRNIRIRELSGPGKSKKTAGVSGK